MSNKCCSCGIDIPEGCHICSSCMKSNGDIVESFIRNMKKNQTYKKSKKRRKQVERRS